MTKHNLIERIPAGRTDVNSGIMTGYFNEIASGKTEPKSERAGMSRDAMDQLDETAARAYCRSISRN